MTPARATARRGALVPLSPSEKLDACRNEMREILETQHGVRFPRSNARQCRLERLLIQAEREIAALRRRLAFYEGGWR